MVSIGKEMVSARDGLYMEMVSIGKEMVSIGKEMVSTRRWSL